MSNSWWQLARGRGARWGVAVLWVLGATLSYSALRDLAVMLGFPAPLGDLFPLVIDVAVWVGSVNALEAREHGRRLVERYAWALVALYSSGTVAGNALVASTEAVDPRLVRALGGGWAHAVSSVAHAAPAVTMILFAHLAGLLMAGRSMHTGVARPAVADAAEDVTDDLEGGYRPRSWPRPDHPSNRQATGDDQSTSVVTATRTAADHGHDRAIARAMTAAEARQAGRPRGPRARRRSPCHGRGCPAPDRPGTATGAPAPRARGRGG